MAKDKEDIFKPELGRLRDIGRSSGKRYVERVLNAAGKLNSRFAKSIRRNSFSGRNIGRGNGIGNGSAIFGKQSFRQRRVVIKARFVKMVGAGFRKAAVHISYIQRDGVSKEGELGKLYNATHDEVDGEEFVDKAKGDRHQFRFIVSPEDANELPDMKIFTRDLMKGAEKDLGTKLDWVAVDHYNTDNPHTHIIVRGVDDKGQDLIIARDYLSRGFRERASILMTEELGPRQDHEIEQAMRREVTKNRLTAIDRNLMRRADGRLLDMRGKVTGRYGMFRRGIELARLEKLEAMGLAQQTTSGVWQLSSDMESTLRDLGQRGDIIKALHAEMKRQNKNPLDTNYQIFRPQDEPNKIIVGKLIAKGFSDEDADRYYLVVEGLDGKTHYADIGQSSDHEINKTGSIIELNAKRIEPRKTDHVIAEIAEKNDGLYSHELHARHDPKASKEFIRTHIRRLEGLRRNNITLRFADGSWEVPKNYIDEVSELGNKLANRSPVNVITRSHFSLDEQTKSPGATWLDQTLVGSNQLPLSNIGFGAEVERALKNRQAYLIEQGFAHKTDKGISYENGLLHKLEKREIDKVTGSISEETGKSFREVQKGDKVEGVYSNSVELASGRFAVIENSKEFSLVPWRSVLERSKGQLVSGVSGGSGISWDIGKKRGIGIS